MGVASCSTVCKSCQSDPGDITNVSVKPVLPDPEASLAAWIRRRSGPECDFGEVFNEIFDGPNPVGEAKFEAALRERGALFDTRSTFARICIHGKGVVGQKEFEQWQDKLEMREHEGLRIFREWLRLRYATPSAAYKAMGKGEGDVMNEIEFLTQLKKLDFAEMTNPSDLFRFVDKDMSGEITFAEFKASMRSVGATRTRSRGTDSQGYSRRGSRGGTPLRSSQSSPRDSHHHGDHHGRAHHRNRHRDSFGGNPPQREPMPEEKESDDEPMPKSPLQSPKEASRNKSSNKRTSKVEPENNSSGSEPEQLEDLPQRRTSLRKDMTKEMTGTFHDDDSPRETPEVSKRPSVNGRRKSGTSAGQKDRKSVV